MATPPTLAELRTYLGVPATAVSDEVLQTMLDASLGDQAARCAWVAEAYPAALTQALYRRVQRELAAKNLPLGMVGVDTEFGPSRIPALDVLIEEHERPYRMQVVG